MVAAGFILRLLTEAFIAVRNQKGGTGVSPVRAQDSHT